MAIFSNRFRNIAVTLLYKHFFNSDIFLALIKIVKGRSVKLFYLNFFRSRRPKILRIFYNSLLFGHRSESEIKVGNN